MVMNEAGSYERSNLVRKIEDVVCAKAFIGMPDRLFRAADYGAMGDGLTLSTTAIQRAIDAAFKAGGGAVVLPQGTSVCGALFLRSNVELRLDKGVVLQASRNENDYPEIWTRIAGIEMKWPAALLNINDVNNVRISGEGIIDGNGSFWWKKFYDSFEPYRSRNLRWALDYDVQRVRPVVVYKSSQVLLQDFTIKRSGFWSISVTYSEGVRVDSIQILNNIGGTGPSTDGIDIDSSCMCLIENCLADTNDDNFCLKSGRDADGIRVNRPTEDVVIRGCTSLCGSGAVTIGSETSGGIRNVEVYSLHAKNTVNGIRFKSAKTRGGIIRDIYIHHVEMENVRYPFHCDLDWLPSYSYPDWPDSPEEDWPDHWKVLLAHVNPPAKGIPELRDIRISDVLASKAEVAFYVNAHREKPAHNVSLKNVEVVCESAGEIRNTHDLEMTNVKLRCGSRVGLHNCFRVESPEYV